MTDKLPASLLEAVDDPSLKGAPLAVLMWLWKRLEPYGYRAVKISETAEKMQIERGTVGKALGILLDGGYLSEGKRDGPYRTFRVLLTRNTAHVGQNLHSRAS